MPQNLIPFRSRAPREDRRQHIRHKLDQSQTVVVELGPNNGGNLIDISGGGVSVQAVAKLHPAVELNLHFRLQGIEHPIEATGRVKWLGPTQKVAGISFRNLPSSTEQQIVDWIKRLQRPVQNQFSTEEPDDSPLPLIPAGLYRLERGKKFELPPRITLETPKPESIPLTEPLNLSPRVAPPRAKRLVLPQSAWISTFSEASAAANPVSVKLQPSVAQSPWWRRKFVIPVAAGLAGILALLLIVASLSGPPSQTSGAPSSQNGEWRDRIRAFFGMEVHKKMDPSKAGVQVWTVQRNGYYYCADDPSFKKLLPGALMAQADAIQSGYQPVLDFCK